MITLEKTSCQGSFRIIVMMLRKDNSHGYRYRFIGFRGRTSCVPSGHGRLCGLEATTLKNQQALISLHLSGKPDPIALRFFFLEKDLHPFITVKDEWPKFSNNSQEIETQTRKIALLEDPCKESVPDPSSPDDSKHFAPHPTKWSPP